MSVYTYSRADLQQMKEKHRKDMVIQHIEYNITTNLLNKAKEGKTQYFWTNPVPKHHLGGVAHPGQVLFTNEELMSALREKFPGTTVETKEEWIQTRPGVKEEKKGILIDWS
jgi:hypothetical protein